MNIIDDTCIIEQPKLKKQKLENHNNWLDTYNKLIIFFDTYKKSPNSHSNDINEKRLGQWLGFQKINYLNKKNIMKNDFNIALWNKIMTDYSTYFLTNNNIWTDKYNKLINFVISHQRIPYYTSINIYEKRLAEWVKHQKQNYKYKIKSMLDIKKVNLWTDYINNYEKKILEYNKLNLNNNKIYNFIY
jgi:hypothetical protein